MKAIILAGGLGSRLYPLTQHQSKQLLHIYDKPMIFYPLSLLMLGGIREVLIITTPHAIQSFKKILNDGSHIGMKIEYDVQIVPRGLPEAFIIGKEFIGQDNVCFLLGDNLFYGDLGWFKETIINQIERPKARIFAYHVANPSAYGVVELDSSGTRVISLEEKPQKPKSNYAIPGLYFFDNTVSQKAAKLQPSEREETEIIDLIQSYQQKGQLEARIIGRGVAWLDTGTPELLQEASNFIYAIEQRQNLKIACLEEIAIRKKFITSDEFKKIIDEMPLCSYKSYLERIKTELS